MQQTQLMERQRSSDWGMMMYLLQHLQLVGVKKMPSILMVNVTTDLQKVLDLKKSSNAEKDAQIKALRGQLDMERKEKIELQKKIAEQIHPREELVVMRKANTQLKEKYKSLKRDLASERRITNA